MAAQLFIGESHVQQAALFGMDESGSILQPDCLGAPLKKVKDLVQQILEFLLLEKNTLGQQVANVVTRGLMVS
jgi:hypothetical protein